MILIIGLLLVSVTVAHNWVNSPARASYASTAAPAMPSSTGLPHAKVIAGQDIQVEWVTGHDSDCYWVLLPEKDHMKNLLKMNTAALDNYINNAPASQQTPPPSRWQKYHRKYKDFSRDLNAGDGFFQATIRASDNDPNYMVRPPSWDGAFQSAPVPTLRDPALIAQAVFFQNTSCTMDDRRVQYNNPTYPFVIAVHRYRLCTARASRPDVTRLTFPAGTPPGRYIAQWQWRGYYDIVDIEIVAGSTPVANPYGDRLPLPPAGVPAQYKRVDHCAFPEATPASRCMRIVTDARACLDMCDRQTEIACQGVGIVPVVFPSGAYKGFNNISYLPYSFGSQCRQRDIERGALPGHLACFAALARPKTDTHDSLLITNDPEDPAFYSTCMVRIPFAATAAGPVTLPPREQEWTFGQKCISCTDAKIFTYEYALQTWNTTTVCANCDIDGVTKLAPADVPVEIIQKDTPWKSRANVTFCQGYGNNPDSVNYNCTASTPCSVQLYSPGVMSQGMDVSERDCYELARKDPRCGSAAMLRRGGVLTEFRDCVCWRGDGGDQPCCGKCVPTTMPAGQAKDWTLFTL